jgi:dCTP deaminase
VSVLGDVRIREAILLGEIRIEPMAPDAIGSNSVDLHLSRHVACYSNAVLDAGLDQAVFRLEVDPDEGLVLHPGELYLCSTVERTYSGPYLPQIEGTSSAARLGITTHLAAGLGDVGWCGCWTLEVTVVRPVRVYGGEPVCQIVFLEVAGDVRTPYGRKAGQNYQGQGPLPQPSRMWRKARFLG